MPDQLLPQPPPDAPAPGPSEAALRSRRKMGWLIGIGCVSMILFLVLMAPLAFRSRRLTPTTEAVIHARMIGGVLAEFDHDYGKFPDSSTVAAVRSATGSTLTLPDLTSNDLFAQLFEAGMAQSEFMFYAKAMSARYPDNVFYTDAKILAHGECGFAYIAGLDSRHDPETPLAFGPVIPGTHILDQKSCDGNAVVLRIDKSAIKMPINSAGKIIYHGLDLFDPRQPFWHGKAPDVKWPK